MAQMGRYYVTYTKRDGTTEVERVAAATRNDAIIIIKTMRGARSVESAVRIA